MKNIDTVAIVGTGLIGGSIALALKKKKLCRRIIGVCLHKKSLAAARKMKAVDTASLSLEAIKDAELVILATPVSVILRLAPKISGIIKRDCLVFDVGSTKASIVRKLSGIFPHFVGTHPLAGSEKRGVANAKADLFQGSLCLITPAPGTDKNALSKVRSFWRALEAKTVIMSPARHDQILGFVSHLSHLSAFALIHSIPNQFLKFSPCSLKEATRVAGSDSELWADIMLDNRVNVLKAVSSLQKNLAAIKKTLAGNDRAELARILLKAKIKRGSLK
jgi:prephenate dehydrogenase